MIDRRTAQRASLLLSALLIAGCGGRPAPPQRSAAPFILPSTAAALTPAAYMQLASTSSLFAIRASELAAERARSGDVRRAAQSIVQDQGGVAAQLSFAGRRLELLPSASLTAEQSDELDRLRQSPDFDSAYRRSVTAALGRALEAHRTFARAGSSPTLRPVAEMAAPVTRRNLDQLGR